MITFLKTRLLASAVTMLIVLHPIAGHAAPVQAAATAAVQMDHISVTSTGNGSPVILIPGLSSPRETYAGQVAALAKAHTVYLVQLNGFGGENPRENLKPGILNGVVADLSAFIARSKLGKPAIVGHSLGGLVGLMFAKAHPDQIGRLMVVDSLPYAGDIFVPGATVAQIEPQAKMMRDMMTASYGKPGSGDAMAQRTAQSMALKPDSQAKVAAFVKASDPRVSGQALYEDLTTDLRPDMAAIATPITLVYPSSAELSKDRADAFYRAEYAKAPNVTFVDIEDAKHFLMLDQPEKFQAALDSFLAG